MKCKDCKKCVIDPETGDYICPKKEDRVNLDDECDCEPD